MDNKKELYYKLEYIKAIKDSGGAIKIKLDFNKHHMKYDEISVSTGTVMKSIFIKGYDYDLALESFLEADEYRINWLYIEFF